VNVTGNFGTFVQVDGGSTGFKGIDIALLFGLSIPCSIWPLLVSLFSSVIPFVG
jgi:hypothetical protein